MRSPIRAHISMSHPHQRLDISISTNSEPFHIFAQSDRVTREENGEDLLHPTDYGHDSPGISYVM